MSGLRWIAHVRSILQSRSSSGAVSLDCTCTSPHLSVPAEHQCSSGILRRDCVQDFSCCLMENQQTVDMFLVIGGRSKNHWWSRFVSVKICECSSHHPLASNSVQTWDLKWTVLLNKAWFYGRRLGEPTRWKTHICVRLTFRKVKADVVQCKKKTAIRKLYQL